MTRSYNGKRLHISYYVGGALWSICLVIIIEFGGSQRGDCLQAIREVDCAFYSSQDFVG